MKNTVKFAALALAAMALTVACKNNNSTVEDTLPVDTLPVIEEVAEDVTLDVDTVTVAEPVAKKASTKKVEEPKTVQKVTPTTVKKEKASEVENLQKGEGQDVKKIEKKANTPTGKPKAADAFKKN